MERRRRRVAWIVVLALAGLGAAWLLSPAPDGPAGDGADVDGAGRAPPGLAARGRRRGRTRFDDLVAWVVRRFEELTDDTPAPTPFEPAPALGPPGALEVVVREEGGAPIPDVRVVLFAPPGATVPPLRSTDAEGRTVFADLPAAPGYLVRATRADLSGRVEVVGQRRVDVRARATTPVVLERPRCRVEGIVRDAITETPVAGATVDGFALENALSLRDRDPAAPWLATAFGGTDVAAAWATAVTGPDGRFALDLGAVSRVELRAGAPDGRVGVGFRWAGPAGAPVELRVRAPRRIHGVVVDGDGRPRAGLAVRASGSTLRAEVVGSAVTDADGRFALDTIGASRGASLVVEGDGVPRFAARVPFEREARIVLPGRAALDLQVVDEAGSPLPRARILASVGDVTIEATTDEAGRARVAACGGPIAVVRVFAPGFGPLVLDPDGRAPATVEPRDAFERPLGRDEARAITVRVRRGRTVRGRVRRADGAPVSGLRVTLSGSSAGWVPSTSTTADGRFEVVGFLPDPPRRATLYGGAGAADGSFSVPVVPDAAAPADRAIDVGDVVPSVGALVRLRVLDPEGLPVASASASGHASGDADADGDLALAIDARRLGAADAVVVDVAAAGFRTREVRFAPSLRPGEVRDLPPLRLERGRVVRVRLVDAGGGPVAAARVAWGWRGDPATTDADGRATLPGAPSDDEWIEVTLADGAPFTFRGEGIRPQATDARADLGLRLPPTRPLEVRVVDPAGAAVDVAWVELRSVAEGTGNVVVGRRAAGVDGDGRARFEHVAAAPVFARVVAFGFVSQEVRVEAGVPAVAVALEPIGDASVRRLAEVTAELERRERERDALDADEDDDEAGRLDRRIADLRAEREQLRGR